MVEYGIRIAVMVVRFHLGPLSMQKNKKNGFICAHCGRWVSNVAPGTKHRDHCPYCLWSQHLDLEIAGDRKSQCKGMMEPIGLTFKHEGWDKWGKKRQGEIMIVYQCQKCGKISINRIAGDDNPQAIFSLLTKSKKISPKLVNKLKSQNIILLDESDKSEVYTQLFGRDIKRF